MKRILGLEGVSKSFDGPLGHERLEILHDIDLEIGEGESISVTGRSGSGKSTLLYVASLIEKPSAGRVFYDDVDTVDWDDRRIAALRRDRMGFVFQNSLLLDDFSALENVMLPLLNKGLPKAEAHRQAACMLTQMGLGDRRETACRHSKGRMSTSVHTLRGRTDRSPGRGEPEPRGGPAVLPCRGAWHRTHARHA